MELKVPRISIGEILLKRQTVTREDIDRALLDQTRTMLPLASSLHVLGCASEAALVRGLSEHFGVPGVALESTVVSRDALSTVPVEVARSHHMLPLECHERSLKIAIARPDQTDVIDEISFATGREVVPFCALKSRIIEAVEGAYQAKAQGADTWAGPNAVDPSRTFVEQIIPPRQSEAPSIEMEVPEEALDSAELEVEPPRPKDAPPRVLAVDDEEAILDLIHTALSKRGVEVVRATRGREALEILQRMVPDMVLLDAMLPEIHGFELCQTIKSSERFKHTPVMIISAIYTGWNFAQDVKRLYGADDYLEKPFRVVELVRRVEEILKLNEGRPEPPDLRQAIHGAALECKRAAELLKSGRVEEAEASARNAVALQPFDARAHFILGTTLQAKGDIYQAIWEFERVVEISPTFFSALKNLAVLYERQGFKAKAVETWMRALQQSPSDAVRQTIKGHLIELL